MAKAGGDGELGRGHWTRKQFLEVVDALMRSVQVFCVKVLGTPVAFWEFCFWSELSAQAPIIQGNSGNDSYIQLLANREEFILRGLIEDVVNHLHCIHESGAKSAYSVLRLPAIEAYSKGANDSVTLELRDGFVKLLFVCPTVVPHMELEQVNGISLKFFADQVCVFENMVCREYIAIGIFRRCRPLAVFRRDLGGSVETLTRGPAQCFSQEGVAFTIPVRPGAIQKIAAYICCELHGGLRLQI